MIAKIKLSGCNLKCCYCPESNRGCESNDVEKIKEFILGIKGNGITEVKWSGGEPTIFKDLLSLVEMASGLGLYQSMSTNGTCSPQLLSDLRKAGLKRVNISLDTLSSEKFKKITGSDYLRTVVENILFSSSIFPGPTKVNVLVWDDNVDEVEKIHRFFSQHRNIIPRFMQLTYKGNDPFVDTHRVEVRMMEEFLPKGKPIKVDGKEFTNPVAEYFESDSGCIHAIIPQDHNCKDGQCNKVWYQEGKIFTCKILPERDQLDIRNSISQIKELISQKCRKIAGVHRIAHVA